MSQTAHTTSSWLELTTTLTSKMLAKRRDGPVARPVSSSYRVGRFVEPRRIIIAGMGTLSFGVAVIAPGVTVAVVRCVALAPPERVASLATIAASAALKPVTPLNSVSNGAASAGPPVVRRMGVVLWR